MLFVFASILACSEKETDTGSDSDTPFAEMDFVLESSEGYSVVSDQVRISFTENSFSLSAGCNSIGGEFTIADDVFVSSEVSMTEMGCEADLMAQDDWFIGFLTSSPTFSFDGSLLTFVNSEASLVFLDSEIATPDQELTAGVWTVDTFIDGETASAYNLSVAPTLEFSVDGSVQFFSGCNNGSGMYEIESDGAISFSDMVATEMACDEMAMAAESHIFSVFSDSGLSYEIDANRLQIVGDSVGLSARITE